MGNDILLEKPESLKDIVFLKTKNKKPTKEELTYCLNLAKEKHCIVRLELLKDYNTYINKNYYMDIDEYFDIDGWLRVNKYD